MNFDSKIYIAGHEGLIGSAVYRRLKSDGYKNIITRSRKDLDLTNQTNVDAFFEQENPEYVVLAAGKVGGIVENINCPADFIRINLAIQANVLSAAYESGVKRLINFGSSCMYPRDAVQPMAENVLFDGIPEPTSMSYAVSKMAGMQMCLAFNQQSGSKRFIPIIPNSVFGPHDNFNPESGHVLSALIKRFHEAKVGNIPEVTLWGTGSPCREFIYSDDIADICLILFQSDLADLEFPINIGSGKDISIQNLAEIIAKTVGYEGRIKWDTTRPDGAPRKLLNSARINRFGWTPSVPFEFGLRSTYRWYLNNVAT